MADMRGGNAGSKDGLGDGMRGGDRVRRSSYPAESTGKHQLRLPTLPFAQTTPQQSPRHHGAISSLPTPAAGSNNSATAEADLMRETPTKRGAAHGNPCQPQRAPPLPPPPTQPLPPTVQPRSGQATPGPHRRQAGPLWHPFAGNPQPTAGGGSPYAHGAGCDAGPNHSPDGHRDAPTFADDGAGTRTNGARQADLSPADAAMDRAIKRMRHPPLTLLLFLQSAPPKVIFSAFQSECAEWGIPWYSGTAQRVAVYLFLRHPVSARFPPRPTTLRTILKQYISLIEQLDVARLRKEEEDIGGDDPVDLELMEAYIELSVTMDGGEENMCYKSYYNVYADDVDGGSRAAADLMAQRMLHGGSGGGGSEEESRRANRNSSTFPTSLSAGCGHGASTHSASGCSGSSHHGDAVSLHGLLPTPPPAKPIMMPPTSARSEPVAHMARISAGSSASTASTCPPTSSFYQPFFEGKNAVVDSNSACFGEPKEGDGMAGSMGTATREEVSPTEAAVLATFCPLKVAVGQFSNVGLSLWPAAFVLTQLLVQEMKGISRIFWPRLFPNMPWPPLGPLPPRQRLKVLELGAGVGLTPSLLNGLRIYRDCVDRFVVTDYQPQLLKNIGENLRINHVTEVEDFRAAERGLEGDKPRPFHLVAPMDWTKRTQNEALLIDWGSNLILAADCIYDVDAIPALVETIRLALSAPSTENIFEYTHAVRTHHNVDAGTRMRVVVVVQTHRQNSTMKQFFDRLKPFAQVQSFTLVTGRTVAELLTTERVSERRDGLDGGLIPLGDWPDLPPHEETSSGLSNNSSDSSSILGLDTSSMPDFHMVAGGRSGLSASASSGIAGGVCALRPDTVLDDGSLASIAHMATPSTSPTTTGGNSVRATSPNRLQPQPPSSGRGEGQRSPRLSPHSSLAASANSSFSFAGSVAASRVKSMLQDALLGTFYTPMAGLIGVHIIQLKEDAKVMPIFSVDMQEGGPRHSGGGGSGAGDGRGGNGGRSGGVKGRVKMGFGFSKKYKP